MCGYHYPIKGQISYPLYPRNFDATSWFSFYLKILGLKRIQFWLSGNYSSWRGNPYILNYHPLMSCTIHFTCPFSSLIRCSIPKVVQLKTVDEWCLMMKDLKFDTIYGNGLWNPFKYWYITWLMTAPLQAESSNKLLKGMLKVNLTDFAVCTNKC